MHRVGGLDQFFGIAILLGHPDLTTVTGGVQISIPNIRSIVKEGFLEFRARELRFHQGSSGLINLANLKILTRNSLSLGHFRAIRTERMEVAPGAGPR